MASEESTARTGLHPRNLHRQRYDFVALTAANPELASFVKMSPAGEATIDFADPEAVKALNRSLLMLHYGIKLWDIPKGYLCPPIPSRADYIHHVADLLAESNGGIIPEGKRVRVLDIGVGANCIFPIIGRHVHGWQFVGADIDPLSVTTAQQIVKFNPSLKGAVEIRLQPSKTDIFRNIWLENERFDLTLCNPPFHSSQADADAKTQRKLRNLGQQSGETPTRNFGGKNAELFVDGGELAFVRRIVDQSIPLAKNCLWFTTFVSKAENLKPIHLALERAAVAEVRTLESRHGQKSNRIVCWTFLSAAARQAWAKAR
ncbi:MAG TPA: 23S rRNA (adenine(1618)-N(6))-methyltransferase RlmF [Bacteroidia bacterium]|nr:23S rRNA (adenine(1618)-N(6))-methyltransferase RlmF [Bacteroidia bacterium]